MACEGFWDVGVEAVRSFTSITPFDQLDHVRRPVGMETRRAGHRATIQAVDYGETHDQRQ